MRRLVLLFIASAALAQDWEGRSALRARVGGKTVASLSSQGFLLGGAAHGWRDDPALSLAVLRATARSREERLQAARFALEERLDARSALDEAGVSSADLSLVERARVFHASGSLVSGVLRVPLAAADFSAFSFAEPFLKRVFPDRVLGFAVERPFGAVLSPRGAGLELRGICPRAHGPGIAPVPGSELVLEHEGLPSPSAYFGFDASSEEEPRGALYAIGSGQGVELLLVDARGRELARKAAHAGKNARLRLVAGPRCRLLADGREVLRLEGAFPAAERVKPVLAVAVGDAPSSEARFGRLVLFAMPDPAWLERSEAPAREAISRALGVELEVLLCETAHFAIETDLGPASLEGLAAHAEAAFSAFEGAFGKAKGGKVRLRIFGADSAFRSFVVASGRAEERVLGGFFDPSAHAITMKVEDADPRPRLAHEVFHAFAAQALPPLPVWLAEGLAEREALRLREESGYPLRYRRALADERGRPRSWRAFISSSSEDFHDRAARSGGVRSAHEKRSYLLAWSLCELAARKPGGVAAKLVARGLAGESIELDEEALDAEWLSWADGR